MHDFKRHLIPSDTPIKGALKQLNDLAADAILFVLDKDDHLLGSLTDGDIRRGFLRGLSFDDQVDRFIQPNPKFLQYGNFSIQQVVEYRNGNFRIIPVVDAAFRVITVINFRLQQSYLPLDAVVMAGGRGERLRPLTDSTPKPLLQVGSKSIIQHNLDRLARYGIDDVWISVGYLGGQIKETIGSGEDRGIRIQYVEEREPLGTLGAVRLIDNLKHPFVLVTNSDLLTNIDYEDFFVDFINQEADLSIVTIPYTVSIPYAVLETNNGHVVSFKEKPDYTYYSNGGIYLLKQEMLKYVPTGVFYNTTDLMQLLLSQGRKVVSYPLHGYWLDIGRHEDFMKAQQDIKHIKL